MPDREAVVRVARSYLRAPFRHQGRTRQGLDCLGLVICVGRDLGAWDHPRHDYPRWSHGGDLEREIRLQCPPVAVAVTAAQPGDLLLFQILKDLQHVALATPLHGTLGMIHAYEPMSEVVEHLLDPKWRARLVGAFLLPGVL